MEYDSLQAATWPGGEGPRWCRPVSMLRAFVGINACVPQSCEIIHLRERRPHDESFIVRIPEEGCRGP